MFLGQTSIGIKNNLEKKNIIICKKKKNRLFEVEHRKEDKRETICDEGNGMLQLTENTS